MSFDHIQLESVVARITCDGEEGSGFALDDTTILTALHCVLRHTQPGAEVRVEFPNLDPPATCTATVIASEEALDLAVLRMNASVAGLRPLPLSAAPPQYDAQWETYGFPATKRTAGTRLTGVVSRLASNSPSQWDVDLAVSGVPAPQKPQGLSGAPIVVAGRILAVVQKALDTPGTLGAVSVAKAAKFLKEASVAFQAASEDLPPEIAEHTQHSLVSIADQQALEGEILGARSGYIVCTGSPGSGKTTFAALFAPRDPRIRIAGRYFVRRPGDRLPVSYRAAEITVAQWIVDISAAALGRHATSARDLESLPRLIEAVSIALKALSDVAGDHVMTVVVDGIEEAIQCFPDRRLLAIFPTALPPNVVIVFTAGSTNVLPQTTLPVTRQVQLTALDFYTCEALIRRGLQDRRLEQVDVELIARRSQGHPLYLRYLIEASRQADAKASLAEVLAAIPAFSGDIQSYYDAIWQSLASDTATTVTLATIAHLRARTDAEMLLRMLPEGARAAWTAVRQRTAHLLEEQHLGVQFYHPSFSEYVIARTRALADDIHRSIWRACEAEPGHPYAAAHVLHHRLLGGTAFRAQAIEECSQAWSDRCVDAGVAPEFVLADVDATVKASLEIGDLTNLVRLLLLRQRLRFRYNVLFGLNAFELARALIHLGRAGSVPLYVTRDAALVVNEESAFALVEQLSAAGANEEASQLLRTVRSHVEVRTAGEDVALSDLVGLLRCMQATVVLEPGTGTHEYDETVETVLNLVQEQYEGVRRKQLLVAFTASVRAYWLWRTGEYRTLQELEDRAGRQADSTVLPALLVAGTEYLARERSELRLERGSEGFRQLIADCEELITRDGPTAATAKIAAPLLLRHGTKVPLVHELCLQYHPPLQLDVRARNGVDPDHGAIRKMHDRFEVAGYCARIPELQLVAFSEDDWPAALGAVIAYVGYVSGRASRLRADGGGEQLTSYVAKAYEAIRATLALSLSARVRWEHAYMLPERIFPFVYAAATSIFCRFAPTLVEPWLKQLTGSAEGQWGLYTEGFRESALGVIEAVLRDVRPPPRAVLLALTKVLERHVDLGVQSRRERTNLLLRLTPIYVQIGSANRAASAFASMLSTSMGPSWYKEAQLGLLNTPLEMAARPSLGWYLPCAASHLRRASGEMTFRRYVRQERGAFIGVLCRQGRVGAAVWYYKHCTVPDAHTIVSRVRAPGVDRVDEESGYEFGIGEIDEQAAILEMITETQSVDPLVQWVFAELFVVGDDRHVNGYAKVFSDTINRSPDEQRDVLARRLAVFVVSDMDAAFRAEFLPALSSQLSPKVATLVGDLLKPWGVILPPVPAAETERTVPTETDAAREDGDGAGLEMPGTFGTQASHRALDRALTDARTEIEMENSARAREILQKALSDLTRGGWSFWSTPISEATDALRLIRSQCTDEREFLRIIAPLVDEDRFAEDWTKADKLLHLLGNEQDAAAWDRLAHVIDDHFGTVLGRDEATVDRHTGLESAAVSGDANAELVDLLIWHLDHPEFVMKERVAARLEWLCHVAPANLVPALVRRALDQTPGVGLEIAAGILHASIVREPRLWQYVGAVDEFIRAASTTRHLCVRFSLIEAAKEAGVEIETEPNTPSAPSVNLPPGGDKPPSWTSCIEEEVVLVARHAPKPRELIAAFAAATERLCESEGLDDHVAADRYIARWLRHGPDEWSRFSGVMRTALNNVATEHLPLTTASTVAPRLLRYNPEWPEADFPAFPCDASEAIQACLAAGSRLDLRRCRSVNGFLYMHFTESVRRERGRDKDAVSVDRYEIICALQHPRFWGYSIEDEDLYVPYDVQCSPETTSPRRLALSQSAPLVMLYPYRRVLGGTLTPARPHPNLRAMCGIQDNEIRRWAWTRGRTWSGLTYGAMERRGSALLVPESKFRNMTPLQPVWVVTCNGRLQLVLNGRGDILRIGGR